MNVLSHRTEAPGTRRAPGDMSPNAPKAQPGSRRRRQGALQAKRAHGGAVPGRRRGPAPHRPLRLALWTTAVLTVGTIFGAAAFHVLLVQSQFRLDRLSDRAAEEQQRYEELRLQVARLAAPERIVATAQERLGMIVPPNVAYLMAPAPAPGGPAAPSLAADWSEVKPYLGARP